MNLPVRLRYLKWNPVGSLYRRNGFQQVGESDVHFLWNIHLLHKSAYAQLPKRSNPLASAKAAVRLFGL